MEIRPMKEAPKDGRTLTLQLLNTSVRAKWDPEVNRWVLDWPLHIESVRDDELAGWVDDRRG